MDHDSSTNSWKSHGDEWSLTWYFWWGIYTSIPTWTSQNSLVAAEALSLSYDQMTRKTITISTQIVKSHVMKQSILLWIRWKVNGNWDSNMIRISQWMESHCRTNTSIRRNKSKRAGLWESQSGIRVGKLTIWVRSFEIK